MKNSIILLICLITLNILNSCASDANSRYGINNQNDSLDVTEDEIVLNDSSTDLAPVINPLAPAKKKLFFFLENSGSMLGYVAGGTEFNETLAKIAYAFPNGELNKQFYFVNGRNDITKKTKLCIQPLGSNPDILKNKLNQQAYLNNKPLDYKKSDSRYSDLSSIFELALDSAVKKGISIIVSDCIYDVGEEQNPLSALRIEAEKTKSKYIKAIKNADIQTIIIKLSSKFEGTYYCASKKGSQKINQQRPYYLIIVGQSADIQGYLKNDYLTELPGYQNIARFIKFNDSNVKYKETYEDIKGEYKIKYNGKFTLESVEKCKYDNIFQFSIAVDYSNMVFPLEYLTDTLNYTCNNNYRVTKIYKPTKKLFGLGFTPTHLLTVTSSFNPYGNLEIKLKNNKPNWIEKTNTDDDSNIVNNTTQTFGFNALTNAISEAYDYYNKGKDIIKIEFSINK